MKTLIYGVVMDSVVEPNPEGLPILILEFRFTTPMSDKLLSSVLLGKEHVEELIKNLQDRLKELE